MSLKLRIKKKKLNEGVDFDEDTLTVSYFPADERNIDTSEITNPTMTDNYVPFVEVWSIFKRKSGRKSDGNPLVYAMKGERGWHFKTPNDKKAIYTQIDKIAKKFFAKYKSDITIVLSSNGVLNKEIAEIANILNPKAKFIDDLLVKMTVEEVREMLLLPKSLFREKYNSRKSFERALS